MKKHLYFLFLFSLSLILKTYSQNKENQWAITAGAGMIVYSEEDLNVLSGRYIPQFPKITFAKYLSNNFTLIGGFSVDFMDDKQDYSTFDIGARYSFGTLENKISPYLSLGGSYIIAESINIPSKLTPTLNFGFGVTYWITDKIGINGQLDYKFSEDRFTSQRSHIFRSAGLVYRFSFSGVNNGKKYKGKGRSSSRKRIWNKP